MNIVKEGIIGNNIFTLISNINGLPSENKEFIIKKKKSFQILGSIL